MKNHLIYFSTLIIQLIGFLGVMKPLLKQKLKINRYSCLLATPEWVQLTTCHWCHVMAHESFEDTEIAKYLNDNYIAIKVDREERPDIDNVYMTACVSLTGEGGWPLSIFMAPDQRPFYAGTYFPKHSNYQRPGFTDLLRAVKQAWVKNREELIKSSDDIVETMQKKEQRRAETNLLELTDNGAAALKKYFDKNNGGFGRAPKFPTPHNLMFLLKYYYYKKDSEVLDIVEKTLEAMYRGGIFDHIGYGFSRYSTDSVFLVPHFEKMLYDNALLTLAYLECLLITGKEYYGEIAERVLLYVERELTHSLGGFFCAQDADSEGEEGKYYTFKPEETLQLLGEEGEYFNNHFDITGNGNFEGKNIPNRIHTLELRNIQTIREKQIDELIPQVYNYRLQRTSLHKDDKILTSWNGLMITACAKAYRVLKTDKYLEMAVKGVEFIEKYLSEKGRLKVRYREGSSKGEGHLEDYAFYTMALLSLYETTYDINYLKLAVDYTKTMLEFFFDEEEGGFFLNAKDSESLIYRAKSVDDNAIPSGNSVAACVLKKLADLTGDITFINSANLQIEYLSGVIDHPLSHCYTLSAMLDFLHPGKELVCVSKDSNTEELRELLNSHYLPELSVVIKNQKNAEELNSLIPYTKDYPLEERTAYYLCQNGSCLRPVYDIPALKELMNI